MPYTTISEALAIIAETTPEIPYWPQLTKRSFNENMYVQFAHDLPNAVLDEENKRFYVEKSESVDSMASVEAYLSKILGESPDDFAYGEAYAAGLYAFVDDRQRFAALGPKAVKGQLTGPISLGLQVTDQNRRALLYDDLYRDLIIKTLRLGAMWQERELKKLCDTTIISIDEPSLSSFGSAFLSLERADAIAYMVEAFSGVTGLKGTHCCGNTDWPMLIECGIDVLFFDAYQYAETIALYADDIATFVANGGILGIGIVPSTEEEFLGESPASLRRLFDEALGYLVAKGLDKDELLAHTLLTPACGVGGTMSPENATKALRTLKSLSDDIKATLE